MNEWMPSALCACVCKRFMCVYYEGYNGAIVLPWR